jgi:ArsR family transcriptional regulator
MSNLMSEASPSGHPVCCTPLIAEPMAAERAVELAAAVRALGDPIRLRMLSMIASHEQGFACVCDLTPEFAVSASTISHHLKVLFDAGLVKRTRKADWIRYRLVEGVANCWRPWPPHPCRRGLRRPDGSGRRGP